MRSIIFHARSGNGIVRFMGDVVSKCHHRCRSLMQLFRHKSYFSFFLKAANNDYGRHQQQRDNVLVYAGPSGYTEPRYNNV